MPLYFQLHASIEPTVTITDLAINTQPQTTSVVVGNSATFTVIVEGGTGPYRYLWQAFTGTYPSSGTWTNLQDTTLPALTSSYIYNTNPPGVGQVRYIRCVVTDSTTASLASDVATMTVVASQAPTTSPITLSSSSPYTYAFSTGGVTDPDGAININWNELALVSGSTTVKRSDNVALTTAQGTWTMNTANPPVVTFAPAGGFTDGTTSVNYYVKDLQGNTSNISAATVNVSSVVTPPPSGSLRVIPTSPAAYSRPALNEVDTYITNRAELNSFISGSGQTAILANGEYLSGQPRLSFAGRNNKTLWAENLHQASFAYANTSDASQSGRGSCISCAGGTNISLNGLRVRRGRYYGIVLSGNSNFEGLPSHHITVSHCLVEEMDMGAIKMDNGSGSPAYKSHHLTVQYSIIQNIGLNPPPDSSPYFCEGIYMGSGESNPAGQAVEDVLILKNYINPGTIGRSGQSSGEAIEAKVGCKNISIIGNDIENVRTGESTSGAAIAIWVNTMDADPGLILIEGNRIRNVQTIASWAAANGIMLGAGATIRNNIITGCNTSAIKYMMKNTASNGVFPATAAYRNVLIEHNTFLGNGATFTQDTGEGPRPTVTSRGNLYQDSNRPSGPNFIVTQDVVPVGSQLVSGNVSSQSTLANTSTLRPVNDSTLTYSGTSSVAYDINGNVRPFGTNKHYGASEA